MPCSLLSLRQQLLRFNKKHCVTAIISSLACSANTDRDPLTERTLLLPLSLLAPCLQASAQSKKQKPGQYLPPKLRGETTTAVARRLIGAGLNMKGFSDKVD